MKDMKMIAMVAAVLAIVGAGYYYMHCHKVDSVKIQVKTLDENSSNSKSDKFGISDTAHSSSN